MNNTYDEKSGAAPSAVRQVMDYVQNGVNRHSFIDGRLPSEAEVAQIVGVSRTPVREAMKILDAMGIIEIRRGVGTFLNPQASALGYLMMFQTVTRTATPHQLFEARLMVEETAARLASASRTTADLQSLRTANAALSALAEVEKPDLDDVTEADIAFHLVMFEICRNPLVAAIGKMMVEQMRPWIRVSHDAAGPMTSVRIHDKMIAAIEGGDAFEAGRAASTKAVYDGLADWQSRLPKPG